MTLHLGYIGAAVVLWALLSGWMFVVSRRHLSLRLFGAVVVLSLAFLIWLNLTSLLGYAVHREPTGRVMLVGMVDARAEGLIYLWVREADGPRAYAVPYSEALAGELLEAEAQRKAAGGGVIMIRFGHQGTRHGDGHAGQGSQNGLGHDHAPPVTITVIPTLPGKS